MAGVSARTLRHYDEVGVLPPAAVSSHGYRLYGRDQLRRLQRILLLRELDVPLPQIKAILAGDDDEASALRRHLMLITAERDRLDRVLATIIRSVDDLERNDRLPDEEFFRGLDEKRSRLTDTLQERFGKAVGESLDAISTTTTQWSRRDYDQAAAESQELYARLSRARLSGVDPTSSTALDLLTDHYVAVRSLWSVTAESYYPLADLIESDPDQRAVVGAADPDLPGWVATAVRAYATQRLSRV